MADRHWEAPWRDAESVAEIEAVWAQGETEPVWRRWIAGLVADGLGKAERVLEVGCGSGLVYEALTEAVGHGLRYRGVDNSEHMLSLAKQKYPRAKFEQADAFALPFADRAYGTVLCIAVLGHIPECGPALAELLRVAKRRVFASVWIRDIGEGRQFAEPSYFGHTREEIEAVIPAGWSWRWLRLPERPDFDQDLLVAERVP